MVSLGFIYGIATFYGLKKIKNPLRKAAVTTTSQMFNMVDHSKEVSYNVKEGVEDIIAEAQYENMKRKQNISSSEMELEVEDFNLEDGIEADSTEDNTEEV